MDLCITSLRQRCDELTNHKNFTLYELMSRRKKIRKKLKHIQSARITEDDEGRMTSEYNGIYQNFQRIYTVVVSKLADLLIIQSNYYY